MSLGTKPLGRRL